jgi:molybdenum cofactor guanylyltransferase
MSGDLCLTQRCRKHLRERHHRPRARGWHGPSHGFGRQGPGYISRPTDGGARDLVIINANRSVAEYAALGHPVIGDEVGGFAGPLAGLQAGLKQCATPFIVTVPCDAPLLPLDLVARLYAALQENSAELAVAKTGDQAQPVFALYSTSLLPSLTAFLESGGRKIDAWYSTHHLVEVPFADESAFANINTLAELQALQ